MTTRLTPGDGGFQLGQFEVYPDRRTLVGPRGETRLEPKVMAVLELLARTPREVVTRNALLDEVWAGTVVTEEVLTRCISELRSALGDRRDAPRYIQTVPKSGYRLLLSPTPLGRAQGQRRLAYHAVLAAAVLAVAVGLAWLARDTVTPEPTPAIAVLPFDDLSAPDAEPYFAEGLAEELMQALARVPGLRVAARTSAFAYRSSDQDLRGIGDALNVSTVLTGSVRRAGDRIRVTAQLTAVDSGYQLWAEAYDREITDVFAIQNEIAASIARELQLELAPSARFRDPLPNVEAYDLYLLGRHHWHRRNPQSLARAAELFAAAIERDPNFALAYSGLADTYLFLGNYGGLDPQAQLAKAEPAVRKAFELGPDLAEPHASLGNLLTDKGDFVGAQKAYERALELNPHFSMAEMWLGNVFKAQGRLRDGHAHYLRAERLDPLHPTIQENLFWSYLDQGAYAEAERLIARAVREKLEPVARFQGLAATLALERGNYADAVELAQRCVALAPGQSEGYLLLARAREGLGQQALADAALAQATDVPRPSYKALVFAARKYALRGESASLEAFVSTHGQQLAQHAPEYQSMLAGWRGVAALRAARPTEAIELLQRALQTSGAHPGEPAERLNWVAHLVLALKAAQESGRADAWARQGREMVAAYDREGLADGTYLVAAALFLAATGAPGEAARRIDDALALGWRPDRRLDGDPLYGVLDAATRAKVSERRRETVERERARLEDQQALPG